MAWPGKQARSRRRSDRRLIDAAMKGSAEAVEALYREHWPRAHRAAYLVVRDAAAAEDIAQEAFLAALRSLDRFDRSRPFAPWLHRIVVNRAIDHGRARSLRSEVGLGADGIGWREPAVEAESGHVERRDELFAAMAELAPESRALVVLRYLLGYMPGEIAEMLELPRGTVNSRTRRALDRLAATLGEDARHG